MTYASYIKREGDTHYFYSFVEDRLTVQSFSGPDGVFLKKFNDIKASVALLLVEQFLVKDVTLMDSGKNTHSYKELRKRCQDFITWGFENKDQLPESVIQNAEVIRSRYISKMISMVSPAHPDRKELIFLAHGIESLYKEHLEFKL